MLASVRSATVSGIDAHSVEVQVDLGRGFAGEIVVGLPGAEVREARDRVKVAVRNSGYPWPNRKVVVNLAPADLRKEGSGFDLPIALAVLVAGGAFTEERLSEHMVVGELALDGRIRPVPGVLSMALRAREDGLAGLMVSADNAQEAAVVEGLGRTLLDLMAEGRISYPRVATSFDLWDAPTVFADLAENPGKVHKAVLTRET